MADEYGTYRAIRRIFVGNALAFNIGDWVPVSHVQGGLVSLDAVELAPDAAPPPIDVFDERVADLIEGDTATRAQLGAAFAAADPTVAITRDPATGLVSSVLEDGVLTVLTRDPVTQLVATIKRGDAPAKTVSRNAAGQATGVAA